MASWTADAKKMLASLKKCPDAGPFLFPVDWKALGLRDYPNIVKQPMDLSTVASKLPSYSSMDEFVRDLYLIVSNCKLYNAEGSEVYEMAVTFGAEIDRLLAQSWKEDAKKILNQLKKNSNAFIFLEPVDWKSLGLTDYLSVIKRPMDLGTISAKLTIDEYSSMAVFFEDIYLVWSNCMVYNADGSDVYKMAVAMKNETDKIRSQLVGTSIPPSVPATPSLAPQPSKRKVSTMDSAPASAPVDSDEPSEEIVRLGRRLSQLQNDYLGSAIRFIYAKCPDSIRQMGPTDTGSLEIDVEVVAKDDSCCESVNQLVKVLLFLQTNPDP